MTLLWDHDALPLTFAEPDKIGGSIEGGQSMNGLTGAINFDGGGYQAVEGTVVLGRPDQLREWNRIASYLNGCVNSVVLPFIWADFLNMDTTTLGFDSDLVGDFDVGETTIFIRVQGINDGQLMETGMIFGLSHPDLLERVYTVKRIVDATVHGASDYTIYEVKIDPPLRDVASNDDPVEWYRPPCRMRLKTGTSMKLPFTGQEFMTSRPSISLVEALPLEDPPT